MKKGIRFCSHNVSLRIFGTLTKQVFLVPVFCLAVSFQTGTTRAELPVTGVPVPALTAFDFAMQHFMEDYGLEGGILAVSKDGCVVYQRGFGYAYNGIDPFPENTPMRLASVEKPLTAAAIRYLIADGVISLSDYVFDVGQPLRWGQRALLDASTRSSTYFPYDGAYGDTLLGDIKVEHLLLHQGGWDRVIAYDPFSTGKTIEIGNATRSTPPGRTNTVRYMMSEPLQFDPNNPVKCDFTATDSCLQTPAPCYCDRYSNYGYMLLSLIIEQETVQGHTDFIRQRVLTPEMWVPSTEIIFGRTFQADQNEREPRYIYGKNCTNVYDPNGPSVSCPYGGFDLESKTGEGNLVASAAPLLTFLDNYQACTWCTNVGIPISSPVNGWKNGGLAGTSTCIRQRDDGINIVVLFNENAGTGGLADDMLDDIETIIDLGGLTWPTACVDGFWVDFNASASGFGGYDDPFHTMDTALAATTDGTKLRIKPGTSNWTGTISERMLLDAPFGAAIIGQ
ncbi:MAG: beta-lactamase family protein [Phycisphaerales bacterium]|nr:MAG: beta-lactamase family protein [Phycisphaerales bacterium]